MELNFKEKTRPLALAANIIAGEKYRITILTEGLVRLEYSEDGIFEDRATQMALFRDFSETSYRLLRTEDGIEIHTSRIQLVYNEKEFSSYGLSIQVKGNLSAYHSIWHYSEEVHDLGGTARTLDMADGEIPLDHGVVSRFGYSLLDDSKSQIILEDGQILPRKKGIQDLYFWGYGLDYKEALRDFYRLTGSTPMLPRYALGNWWSRFYAYSEDTYLALLDEFQKRELPFTVAVIDMDWHVTDIDPKYGSGWTGYTWNRELFPDPPSFLKKLHERGLHVTLNDHPAEGVKAHEEMYVEMAKALGVDYENEDPVNFDIVSPEFVDAYFKYLHHPKEKEGVDFWWLDWQQGGNCKVEGLDPLWLLNHYHYLDNGREGKRAMTFSRYAGPGSHRYPIGFSGDTLITWESLEFQPYFTATASNIGYGWWSNDIGGHMLGYKNDELTARWVQFGAFSPILRLHSSRSEFNGKEPWRFKKEAELAMSEALRVRHRMMPYLYTMNYRSYAEGLPMILPMYYEYPQERNAYQVKNQYFFGTELIVAPVTAPRIANLNVAKVAVWLPEGLWHDIYTGVVYQGGRCMEMYRTLDSIPVLAKAGAILPFTEEIKGIQASKNPESFTIHVYSGADGSFELYEDDNETQGYEKGDCVKTRMTYEDREELKFTISPAEGNCALIPEKRTYRVYFHGFPREMAEDLAVISGTEKLPAKVFYEEESRSVVAEVADVNVQKALQFKAENRHCMPENSTLKNCFDFLNQAEIEFLYKDAVYEVLSSGKSIPMIISHLSTMNLNNDLFGALLEQLTAL